MTWNFPEDQIGKSEAYGTYINQLKTEVEQIKKLLAMLPEGVLGTVGGGATNITIGGGGDQEKCFAIGKTTVSSTKSATTATAVSLWEWNGSAHVGTLEPLSAYNLFGSIGANKWVALAKDIDTDAWYITAAECGD